MSELIYNLEAEQSVLGAILIDAPAVLPRVVDTISPDDFYLDQHRRIYTAMLDMFASFHAVDAVTLIQRLNLDVGGEQEAKAYLLTLAQIVPSTANVGAYADIVASTARARKLQAAIAEADGSITAETADGVAEELAQKLFDLKQPASRKGLRPLSEVVLEYYKELGDKSKDNRINLGYDDLDRLLGGIEPGDLCILAARPSVGKTAFALNVAQHVAVKYGKVALFSLEMRDKQLVGRMMAGEAGINLRKLRSKDLDEEGFARAGTAADRLYKVNIELCDRTSVTPMTIRNECRMKHDLKLIVIDYIGLMSSGKKTESQNLEISSISRDLKIMAGDLGAPVLALSQLNREGDGGKPSLRNLRDSGALEQDADEVLFLWPVDRENGIVGASVAKGRNSEIGDVQLQFDGAHMRFYGMHREDYVQQGHGGRARKYEEG